MPSCVCADILVNRRGFYICFLINDIDSKLLNLTPPPPKKNNIFFPSSARPLTFVYAVRIILVFLLVMLMYMNWLWTSKTGISFSCLLSDCLPSNAASAFSKSSGNMFHGSEKQHEAYLKT